MCFATPTRPKRASRRPRSPDPTTFPATRRGVHGRLAFFHAGQDRLAGDEPALTAREPIEAGSRRRRHTGIRTPCCASSGPGARIMGSGGAVLAAERRAAARRIGRMARSRAAVGDDVLAIRAGLAVRIAAVLMPIAGAVILTVPRRGRQRLARGSRRRERQRGSAKQEDIRFHRAFSFVKPPKRARTGADMMRARSGGGCRCPAAGRRFSPAFAHSTHDAPRTSALRLR